MCKVIVVAVLSKMQENIEENVVINTPYSDSDNNSDDGLFSDDIEKTIQQLKRRRNKKGKAKMKKGRKPQWTNSMTNELVEIILNDELLKRKLILEVCKTKSNSMYYEKVIKELKTRRKENDDEFLYSVMQTRDKFKRCMSKCREAAMIVKTESGIANFRER